MIKQLYLRLLKFILAPLVADIEDRRVHGMSHVRKNREAIDSLCEQSGQFAHWFGDPVTVKQKSGNKAS